MTGMQDWIAAAAAFAAGVSALVAFLLYKVSTKNLSLATAESSAVAASWNLYLIDSFSYRGNGSDRILYFFCLSVENRSKTHSSVVSVEMKLTYTRDDLKSTAVFLHNGTVRSLDGTKIKNILHLPAYIQGRQSITANCVFEVPRELISRAEWNSCVVKFSFADGEARTIEPKVIMDVVDVENLKRKRNAGVPV